MLILGFIMLIGGVIAAIYAYNIQQSSEYALASMFGSGETTKIDMILYIGIIAIVIGVVLIVKGYIDSKTDGYKEPIQPLGPPPERIPKENEWRCPICNRVNANYVGTCACGKERTLICEMCGKESVILQKCVIKDDLGTRYRKICSDCIKKHNAEVCNK